ncbi:addiction module toxin, HicA family [Photorhabdus laumondii subsp. laumondii]|uniref:Photorhabdus luminescens subsp. laumondii TTO1 complete genome segment 3/17 n=2 Tax=Photorhabdus laumondii subsp. laumondii TaxID=141679 RepID=Q7N8L3_PHOLL|nr:MULTISPECIES: type II toxin-antitoxin system HicA family toxin [Photorhabdus]AWK40654.1 hexulose-6-phosphate synthase [Photorhabdus laumondii subsp. laumondii]AXG41472.1 type II toxin-antitoxin system HicA family toxin [Photorhabdus laumondii subsp. laumondii]AXG45994.1 type II toxin-antitoxin system HicA family toxin [Photorhabdus laumondii subsp. laumondii]KTL59662.1 hexulose-6-phosphate synthase [Photorhabdus laumondii subsp. laumondii]MBS9426167.1 type II toxin-antitoxin system HicA fam
MKEQVSMLRKRQKNTLEQIFKMPVPAGIKWSDVESLIIALGGEVKEGKGSRCRLLLNDSIARFHRPHPSPDTDKGAVVSLREWLESIGVEP